MKQLFAALVVSLLLLSGCSGNLSPLSPKTKQKLQNQNGKIEELKNNQNGIALDIGKLRNETQVNAEKINSFQQQQGMLNKENSGVQIFQGDGGIIAIIVLAALGMLLVYYYRTEALKAKKVGEILAHEIVLADNLDLEDQVFFAAMHSDVEPDIYHLMVKKQAQFGVMRHRGVAKS